MRTGLIGLGAMGNGMAHNLEQAGWLTALYNRTTEKTVALAKELNVKACLSVQQLAQDVDLVLICVAADKDVLEVITTLSESIKPGTVVVDMSTVSRETAIKAANLLQSKQASFLDAPVSGGKEGADKGSLVMMVGGDATTLEKVYPVLESMTQRIEHIGEIGMGQACKAVNQVMAAGINQAVTEALAFGQGQDLPMTKVIELIASGAAGNWFLQHRGQSMIENQFEPGFKVALHHKDLLSCQQMAIQADIAIPLTDKTLADYQQLIEQGYADEDISALFRLKK